MIGILVATALIQMADLNWILHQGENHVSAKDGTISVTQVGDKRTIDPAFAIAKVESLKTMWSISCQISFQKLGEHGARFSLDAGNQRVAWIGADKWYGAMSVFIGPKMVHTTAANTQQYVIEFNSDGTDIVAKLDGKAIGRVPCHDKPDQIYVGSGPPLGSGTQTEIIISNVQIKSKLGARSPSERVPAATNQITSPIIANVVDIGFSTGSNGSQFLGLVSGTSGGWFGTLQLENKSQNSVVTCLRDLGFSNGSSEPIYILDKFTPFSDARVVSLNQLGFNCPDYIATRTGLAIVPTSTARIGMLPGETKTLKFYCEDGGGWVYRTVTRRHGTTTAIDASPERVSRFPDQIRLFVVSVGSKVPINESTDYDIQIQITVTVRVRNGAANPRDSILSYLRSTKQFIQWLQVERINDSLCFYDIPKNRISSYAPKK